LAGRCASMRVLLCVVHCVAVYVAVYVAVDWVQGGDACMPAMYLYA